MKGSFEPFGNDYQAGTMAGASQNGIYLRLPGQWDDGTWADATSGAGIYYNVHRWYSPQTERFTKPDPLGILEGGVNLLTYASSNPLSNIDPLGLRFYNLSCQTILYKPETGSGGAPARLPANRSKNPEGDGFYANCGQICGSPPGQRVFKVRSGIDVVFEGGCQPGECVRWRFATTAGAILSFLDPGDGWKDDLWFPEHPDWPTPPDCCEAGGTAPPSSDP